MEDKYKNMSAPELAGDDAFIRWVRNQDDHDTWSKWQQRHPEQAPVVDEAIHIVRSVAAIPVTSISSEDRGALWEKINASIQQASTQQASSRQTKIKPLLKWVLTAAAALALVVWINTTKPHQFMAFYGEQQSIELPESSQVVINAGSDIKYKRNFVSKREIKLTGEAFFEVQPGTTFTVVTDQGTVTVLGTSFNVIAWPERFEVSCFTGKVRVQVDDKDAIEITPGEKVVESNENLEKKSFLSAGSPSWMNGKFTFENQPLSAVMKEFERQFGVEVTLEDGTEDIKYTGLFEKGDLAHELENIIWPLHLKADVNGKNVTISR